MSISKEKKLSPMFECWTADRVWISFLFLTTWKLSHLIKTKFVESEKRVLRKKTSKKKKERKEEEKKRKLVSDEIWTCAFGREKQRKNTKFTHSNTPASAEGLGLKQVHIPSPQWLAVFRNKFFCFLYNYGIFNWTYVDKKLKIKSSSFERVDWTW